MTAGSMVPLIWLSLRRGAKIGIFACAVYGLVQLALEPFIFNPLQVVVDYPLAFGVLGLAGFFSRWPRIHLRVPTLVDKLVAAGLCGLIFGLFLYELAQSLFIETEFFGWLFVFTYILLLRLVFSKPFRTGEQYSSMLPAMLGTTVGITGRFLAHFASGVWFFPEYAPPGMSPVVYSAIYNGSYIVPELIVTMYFMYLIAKSNLLKAYE